MNHDKSPYFLKYIKYKTKYLDLKNLKIKNKYSTIEFISNPSENFEEVCSNIYSIDTPLNIFLRNFQRKDDAGYFNEQCYRLDTDKIIDEFDDPENPYISLLNRHQLFKDFNGILLLKNIFGDILINYNNLDTNVHMVKMNIGLTMILTNCVVRIYPLRLFGKIKNLYNYIISLQDNPDENFFEKVYHIYESYYYTVIVTEKLTPVKIFSDGTLIINPEISSVFNSDTAKDNIEKALNLLHREYFTHNDVRLDNVGFRKSDGKYILYDFDMVKSNSTMKELMEDTVKF